jgi:UDP-glucose 4-epimerase
VTEHVGEAFNVGTGRSVSIRELAERVKSVTGSVSEIVHTDPREGDIEHSRADVSKAESLLGYTPQVGLERGLKTIGDAPAGRESVAPSVD